MLRLINITQKPKSKMNTKKLLSLGLIALASMAVVLTGCRRNNESTLSSSNNALAEAMFDDVYKQIDEAASQENGLNKSETTYNLITSQCATVTLEPVNQGDEWPKRLTIDFGTDNCIGTDGRARRGKIICVFDGLYRDEGTQISTTLDGYYVNDYHVEGIKTVTNGGRNSDNQLFFSITVQNASITTPDGTIEWESTRTRTWVEGEGTTFWTNGINGILDDVYEISGSASGTNINGNDFDVQIVEPLRVQIGCRWVTAGVLDLTPNNLDTRSVDYGDGNCDNAATVTVNGNTYNFTMN